MDPTATWNAFLEAIVDEDIGDAACRLADLAEWLAKGGFPPKGMTYTQACALSKVLARGLPLAGPFAL